VARIVIVGGYGNAGARVARLLAPRADVTLVLAGRSGERAARAVAAMGDVAANPVEWRVADVDDARGMRALVEGAALVVCASSASAHAAPVARAALDAGADSLDTTLSLPEKHAALGALDPLLRARGRCAITDAGFHPGVPGALARWAAARVRDLDAARVGGAFAIDWRAYDFSPATMSEFVRELAAIAPETMVDGAWCRSWRDGRRFDFGPPVGARWCVPWGMREMRDAAAAIPTLRDAGFHIAGFGPVIDWVAMPFALIALRLLPRSADRVGRLFLAALRRWGSRDRWAVLQLEGHGRDAATGAPVAVRVRLAHEDAYDLTAIPIAACIEQLLDGERRAGVWTQACFVEPERFLARMAELGVEVCVEGVAGPSCPSQHPPERGDPSPFPSSPRTRGSTALVVPLFLPARRGW
jgi:saccharopine dehydrogenase (NAD+, L-lysine-forming)